MWTGKDLQDWIILLPGYDVALLPGEAAVSYRISRETDG
jgi:hypothetical protein